MKINLMDDQSLAEAFVRFKHIMDELREKCPWDQKQTIQSLRSQTIEELYELTESITASDWKGMKEELGDLMLHVLFYSKIASEEHEFTIEDVIRFVSEKLIYRHPHIYGDVTVKDENEVKRNWEQLKLREGKKSVLSGVPASLPAIVKAARVQEKSKQVGFEWETNEQVWDKVEEEMEELHEAVLSKNKTHIEEEFGDVLFSLVNYARFLNIDAENALELTNRKFISRFSKMEEQAKLQGRDLSDMSLAEMDEMWNSVKKLNTGS